MTGVRLGPACDGGVLRLAYGGSMDDLTWTLRWEADLSPAESGELGHLLAAVYPAREDLFRTRSWNMARPEARVTGFLSGRPVAHLGFLRRQLRVGAGPASVYAGDIGLVGVAPELRGAGVGLQLLRRTATIFGELELSFGFVTCRPAVVPFYAAGGWILLPGQVTSGIDRDHRQETYRGPTLVLPVRGTLAQWPRGEVVARDGQEV
jgi:nodulation protein A